MNRDPDAQRLVNVRKTLRKVARNVERHSALPAATVTDLRTLAADCAEALDATRARLEGIQPT